MPRSTTTPTTSSPSASSAVPPSPSPSDFASSVRASRPSRSPSPSAPAEDPDPDPDPRITTRREEAFTLYCQGYRSPAIATLLGVPQRTVRSWIAATLQQTADESRTRRDQQLRLAIESQRAIVKAAWHAYERAARAERLTLEHLQNAVPFNVDDAADSADLALDLDSDPYGPPSPPQRRGGQGVRTTLSLPRLPTLGARYLQIVLHAQREIARLSGLYHLPASVHDPNAGRPMQIVIRREAHLPREQRVAWTAFRQQWDAAHPDDPVPPDDLVFPPPGAPLHDYGDPDDPDDPESGGPDLSTTYPNDGSASGDDTESDDRTLAIAANRLSISPSHAGRGGREVRSTSAAHIATAAETASPTPISPASSGTAGPATISASESPPAFPPPIGALPPSPPLRSLRAPPRPPRSPLPHLPLPPSGPGAP